jgi:RNA polymerase sigma-70 factor (ECF subfamily)
MKESSEVDRLKSCSGAAERRRLLAELFEGHRSRLRTMLRLRLDRRLQARVDPSDVLQEAFLAAAAGIDRFLADPRIPLYLWLRFLAGRKLEELHRRHLDTGKRDPAREVSLHREPLPMATSAEIALELLGKDPSPSDAAARAELRARLEDAIESLQPLDREVLALRHFEELRTQEVAHALGIEEATARKRYLRAVERLRKVLARLPGFGPGFEGDGP